jgi:hypothetical protein
MAQPVRRGPLVFILSFAFFLALSLLWAFAAPLMSGPDEATHSVKAAAVVRGQWLGQSGDRQGQQLSVQVPEYIANSYVASHCFIQKPWADASCGQSVGELGTDLTQGQTSAGNYNPLYYAIVGLPSLVTSGQKALYGMRIVSAIWCSLLLAIAVFCAHVVWRRRLAVVATAIAATPMTLALAGSINPNGVEATASLACFTAACACLTGEASRSWKMGALFGVSAIALANSKGLSILWLCIIVLFAAALCLDIKALRTARAAWVGAALGLVGIALGLLWLKVSDSFESLIGAPVKDTPAHVVMTMLDRTFEFLKGAIGVMGWLDAPLPDVTFMVWGALACLLLVGAMVLGPARVRWAVLGLAAAIWLLPAILQVPTAKTVGYIWQGRYILALVVVLFAGAGVAFGRVPQTRLARRATTVSLAVIGAANVVGFVWVLRRYVIGLDLKKSWATMVFDPAWQPFVPWEVLAVLYAVVTAAGVLALRRYAFPPDRLAGSDATARSSAGSR